MSKTKPCWTQVSSWTRFSSGDRGGDAGGDRGTGRTRGIETAGGTPIGARKKLHELV
jgi:hypothetical protein